ncbi:hypothetical protein ACVVCI_003170 [Escherichia coli]
MGHQDGHGQLLFGNKGSELAENLRGLMMHLRVFNQGVGDLNEVVLADVRPVPYGTDQGHEEQVQ